jgi:hypothetical protein
MKKEVTLNNMEQKRLLVLIEVLDRKMQNNVHLGFLERFARYYIDKPQ